MKPGEKIICINAKKQKGVDYSMFPQWIVEGETYHIRRVEGSMSGETRVLLDEVHNPSIDFPTLGGKAEPGFSSSRFANYEQYILGNVNKKEQEYELHSN